MWRAVERWGSQIKAGLNFDFLSRLFGRPKAYSQFESSEDIFSDAREELTGSDDEENDIILMRDSDSYEVTYERRRTQGKGYGASSDYDVQIHSDNSGTSKLTCDFVHDQCNSCGDCQYDCTGRTQKSSARHGHHRQGSSVREEVGGLVTCVFQRQYNKLENDLSDDDHSSHEQDQNSVCDSAKEADSNSNVFHSIKDVNPTWKAKKPKRRKKIAKRTRRMIRVAWKWVKRGMSQYAQAFTPPTFLVCSVTGSAVNKSNLRW